MGRVTGTPTLQARRWRRATMRRGITAGLMLAILAGRAGSALAFPTLGSDVSDAVPEGTELSPSETQDLQHQLLLSNGLVAPSSGGWTIIPRIDMQEMLTDNAEQVRSPRVSDLVTYIAPGIGIAGDLPRIQVTLDYSPVVTDYARTSKLNTLTQQLSALSNVTLLPDSAYVDLRATSGVSSIFAGGASGLGGIGIAPSATNGGPAGNSIGLTKNNEAQTSNFSVSPYLVRRFGDWGTGRIGYSGSMTETDTLSGFASPPFPTGGTNASRMLANEENANFVSGDALEFLQDTVSADMVQSKTTTGAAFQQAVASTGQTPSNNVLTSVRNMFSNQVSYQLTQNISVFASGGYEDIEYSSQGAPRIRDLTWSFGSTVIGPNTNLTVSYGHQYGFNSLSVTGRYSVTPRTGVFVNYSSTLGTQLEQVQNQLNSVTVGPGGGVYMTGPNGVLINPATGQPLTAFGVEDGIFKTTTLDLGAQTSLDRDNFGATIMLSKQSSAMASRTSTGTESDGTSLSVTWTHQMRPDMTLNALLAYTLTTQPSAASAVTQSSTGRSTTLSASLMWQWQLSDRTSASIRYAYYERSSAYTLYDMYANMLILGITKRF